jgi:hypothetical protein
MAKTRQELWEEAAQKAVDGLQEMIDMQAECQEEYDKLSEKQQEGEKGDGYSEILNLDLQTPQGEIEDARDLEIPESAK